MYKFYNNIWNNSVLLKQCWRKWHKTQQPWDEPLNTSDKGHLRNQEESRSPVLRIKQYKWWPVGKIYNEIYAGWNAEMTRKQDNKKRASVNVLLFSRPCWCHAVHFFEGHQTIETRMVTHEKVKGMDNWFLSRICSSAHMKASVLYTLVATRNL